MKSKILLSLAVVTMFLSGCAQFSKGNFYKESFGVDLTPYTEVHTSSYSDGVLELYDVSSEDDAYKQFFKDGEFERTTSMMFGYESKKYYPNDQAPIYYIDKGLVDPSDGYHKYVLYLPEKKIMVFIYADAVGG
jgi:hypothetical protein